MHCDCSVVFENVSGVPILCTVISQFEDVSGVRFNVYCDSFVIMGNVIGQCEDISGAPSIVHCGWFGISCIECDSKMFKGVRYIVNEFL